MVRRPYFWLLSTCRRPYGISFLEGGDGLGEKIRGRVRFSDLSFESLVDLWNAYYRAYEMHLEPYRVVYVRLEDLVNDPKSVVLELQDYATPIPGVDLDQLIPEIAEAPAKRHRGAA